MTEIRPIWQHNWIFTLATDGLFCRHNSFKFWSISSLEKGFSLEENAVFSNKSPSCMKHGHQGVFVNYSLITEAFSTSQTHQNGLQSRETKNSGVMRDVRVRDRQVEVRPTEQILQKKKQRYADVIKEVKPNTSFSGLANFPER